jgi:hypothetical protein
MIFPRMITTIDPLFFCLWKKSTKTYDLSSLPMLLKLRNLLSSHKILSLRGTWVTYPLQSRLTFQSKKVSWKTSTLVLIEHLTKWFLTPLCSRNSAMSSHGVTRKCQGLTLQSLYMKLKPTLTRNRFGKSFARFIPRNSQL